VELAGLASVIVRGRAKLVLTEGALRIETTGELTIVNRWNDRLLLRDGAARLSSDLRAIASQGTPPRVEGDRLKVTVERGQAVLRGSGGELTLDAGERGRIGDGGKPEEQ
jgi:hypothetical protein